ncbi:leucine-rich repeat-containing protein 58-like [Asterias rubens]|uniref:leucine-rich repeat-containing protein 58-like n=1 Tax=Asterias rubens TaxID=7604 RepID=UPI001455D5BF|nr:leucine-rich repeat-containing protein 58-like [Asterias rubens]XP_033632272.1 leucine-rich repeat-containing protein 58-like [Asterias rubens]
MGSSIGGFLDDLFRHGDVQMSSIAIFIIGLLCFTVLCLIFNLLFHKPPPSLTKRKRRKSLIGCAVHSPSVPSTRHRGNSKRVHKKNRASVNDNNSSSKVVLVTCREVPRYQPHALCVTCGRVPSKKACRYSRCGECCRANKASICAAHGTGVCAAVGIVEGALDDKPLELDLSYMNLKKCPPRIGYVGTQLVCLNLINNRLTELPEEIGLLRGLEELFLQYNCLEELPDTIGQFHKLQELDCKNNHLCRLPASIGNLSSLSMFNATNNLLRSLPTELGNLTRLEELCLHSNQLTELPDSICNLVNLTALYLGENRITKMPAKLGKLIMLTELDLSSCELVELPDSLSRCTSLIKVWLSNNKLCTLPDQMGRLHQLKELHVRNNRIKYFPASLSYLQLYTFSANQNRLLDEWDRSIKRKFTVNPDSDIPPLLELTARTIASCNIEWQDGDLPSELADLLRSRRQCSSCEGPFFRFYQSELVFANIGIFHRVPLYQQICSPFNNMHCQPVDLA